MKFRKPQDAREWLKWRSAGAAHELSVFLDSLPAEFEILGLGEVAVKWPGGLTKDHLDSLADSCCRGAMYESEATFRALAAIAPERKKLKVNLWRFLPEGELELKPTDWAPFAHHEWRKVAGPIEIDD